MKDYEKMTVKELVDELTGLGVTFNKKSRKADLIALLQEATESKSGAETKSTPAPETKSEEHKKAAARKTAPKDVPAYSGYAIIRTGGKQYQVSAGSLLRVEKIKGDVGDVIELKDVLAVIGEGDARIGKPTVEGAVVTATIVEQDKAKKVLVFKKKKRKGYRVKRGHRQMYTAIKISDITL